nr:MAG TPA: hypothetical protein [Bacteriophage sp.]
MVYFLINYVNDTTPRAYRSYNISAAVAETQTE